MKSLKSFLYAKITTNCDMKCISECVSDDTDTNKISMLLKNMVGDKKKDLIGMDIESIDMNMLLPESFRHIHDNFMIDIITKKEKSKFWNDFISGKMIRSVNIINPVNGNTYSVKIDIKFKSHINNVCIFDVCFNNTTLLKIRQSKPNLYSHDLRAMIKCAINITEEIELGCKSDCKSGQNVNLEQVNILKDLLTEALDLCSKSQRMKLPESITIETKNLCHITKPYLEMSQLIIKLNDIYPNVKYNIELSSSLIIGINQFKIFADFMLVIVNNLMGLLILSEVINITLTEDKINKILFFKISRQYTTECLESPDLFSNLDIKFIQNDIINIESSHTDSFDTTNTTNTANTIIPKQIELRNTFLSQYKNNFISICNEWNKFGCTNAIIDKFNNIVGYTLSIKCDYAHEIFSLNTSQVKLLSSVMNKQKLLGSKIILLVDDVLLNLKIICLKIIKLFDVDYKYNNFPILTPNEWQEHGIITIEIHGYIFIMASNGYYGLEISRIVKCNLIITDIQMPLLNGFDMIKLMLSYKITSKIMINSAAINETDAELIELVKNNQIGYIEKGSNFEWINDLIF